jgi:hypothetical protein
MRRVLAFLVPTLLIAMITLKPQDVRAGFHLECWPASSEYIPPECTQWDNSGENPECVNWSDGYVRINEAGCRSTWYDDGTVPPDAPGKLACLDGCRQIRQDDLSAAADDKLSCERAVEREAERRCASVRPAPEDTSDESRGVFGLCIWYQLWRVDGSVPLPGGTGINVGTGAGLLGTCSDEYDSKTIQAWRDEENCRSQCLS